MLNYNFIEFRKVASALFTTSRQPVANRLRSAAWLQFFEFAQRLGLTGAIDWKVFRAEVNKLKTDFKVLVVLLYGCY